jgi:hypothetical protein
MNIHILLIMGLCFLVPCKKNDNEPRTHNFPKNEIKADKLPKRENTWVFILSGQSNMAGRAHVEPQDTIPSDRVFTINKNGEVIIAKEPLHYYEPSMTGLDCGLSFGNELIKHIPDSISILMIPTAVGGSSIGQWLGDSTFRNVQLFTNFNNNIVIGKQYGTIKGVLWHQGETDAKSPNDIKLYKNRLVELFIKFRKTVKNEKLPIIVGELGSFSKNSDNWKHLNNQIELYVSSDSNASIVRTSDLKDRGDKLHFDSEGQRLLGKRFANEYIKNHK